VFSIDEIVDKRFDKLFFEIIEYF